MAQVQTAWKAGDRVYSVLFPAYTGTVRTVDGALGVSVSVTWDGGKGITREAADAIDWYTRPAAVLHGTLSPGETVGR